MEYLNVQSLFLGQQQTGIQRVVDGFLHPQWAAVHHHYYVWLQQRTTGFWWLSQVIRKFWDVLWDLWMHRNCILHEDTSAVLAHRHDTLNAQITDTYASLTEHTPDLARFFWRSHHDSIWRPLTSRNYSWSGLPLIFLHSFTGLL